MVMRNNFIKSLFIFTFLFFLSCNNQNIDKNSNYDIDITIIYDNNINSYKISKNGEVLFLSNKLNQFGKLYRFVLDKKENENIQKLATDIVALKCDSLKNSFSDEKRHIVIFKNQKSKITLVSNTCKNEDKLNNFVFSIVKKFKSIRKNIVFETLEKSIPPELPDSLNIQKPTPPARILSRGR